jgi:MFS family permease
MHKTSLISSTKRTKLASPKQCATSSDMTENSSQKLPHPIIWLILYVPFGALGGFTSVALTFLATKNGLSITEGSLIIGAGLLVSWLKWLWAPLVDITLTPKKWYVISTAFSALGVWTMSVIPLNKENLGLLLFVIAASTLLNSIVGMAVEAMIASTTPHDQVGRVSAWFQAGNLGGAGVGGALGLFLMQYFTQPWIAGTIMGALFMACCFALLPLPYMAAHVTNTKPLGAIKKVAVGFWAMVRERVGLLTAFLCCLPVATGAAQGTLTQASVAAFWGAGAEQVELVQGLLSGVITAAGCFLGGWVCNRMSARMAYSVFGIALAVIAIGMAVSPATVAMYVVWNMIYALGVGLSYSAFTAMALVALGRSAAATGYNVFASLSNFPIWWLGLLLGWTADHHGPRTMLWIEAICGILGVMLFLFAEHKVLKDYGHSSAAS